MNEPTSSTAIQFDHWMRTGPLANESLTDRERVIAQIAFNEGRTTELQSAIARIENREAA